MGALVCRCLQLPVTHLVDQMASEVYRVTYRPARLLLNKAAVTKRYRHSPPRGGVRVVCKCSAAEHLSKAAQVLIELVSLLILCSGNINGFLEVYPGATRSAIRSREYVLCE